MKEKNGAKFLSSIPQILPKPLQLKLRFIEGLSEFETQLNMHFLYLERDTLPRDTYHEYTVYIQTLLILEKATCY